MSRIVISYRRDDSADVTGRIYDHLSRRFGRENVFKDVDTIAPGADFRKAIADAVSRADVFLEVIGNRWLTVTDAKGRRRIDDPADFVRIEVETALERQDLHVIPVLVRSAEMPLEAELPESIKELAFRNACKVRDDPDFRHDVNRLIEWIAQELGNGGSPEPRESVPSDAPQRLGLLQRLLRWWHDRKALRRYLDRVIDEHRYFTFLGRAKPLDLERIYIALKVGEYVPPQDRPDHPAPNVAADPPVALSGSLPASEALLLDPPRLLILGEPGSGKTTLLKYLALRLASRDPAFGEFARKYVPNRWALSLDRIHRGLAELNSLVASLLLGVASLVAWLVALFFSPYPNYGAMTFVILLFTCMNIVSRNFVVASSVISVTMLMLFGGMGWMPWWSVTAVAVALLFLLWPYLRAPVLRALRWACDRCTVFPLPLYLTLNDQARGAESPQDRLTVLLAEAGLSDSRDFLHRLLTAGRCIFLLDALDEVVDGDARNRIVDWIGQTRIRGRNPLLVTCRIAAFEGQASEHQFSGFRRMEVQEFTNRQIELFIQNWFADRSPEEQAQRVAGLVGALGRNPRMQLLASNPLLLSLIALLYERNWQLPERRVDLYEECVDVLLEEWDRAKGLETQARFDQSTKSTALQSLAVRFHQQGVRQFTREDLKEALPAATVGLSAADCDALLEEIMSRSNLIRRKSKTSYDFAHLTFQEYFTAKDFDARRDVDGLLRHLGDAWWREVILLFAGLQQDATGLLDRLHQHDVLLAAGALADARPVATEAFACVADRILGQLKSWVETDGPRRQQAADALAEVSGADVRDYLLDRSRDEHHPDAALAAVLALGRCADRVTLHSLWPRMGPVLRLLHQHLGHPGDESTERVLAVLERLGFAWVFVPAGEFVMGEGTSQRQVHVKGYWIGKYPVTNAQFAQFAEETGHREGRWRSAFTSGKDRHPVVCVSWDEAMAFCEWAGVGLPSEQQWEKAARGTDGRVYPWGNQWDPSRCNSGSTGTTPVDQYSNGSSPYCCVDMAGNVSEWCADSWGSVRVFRGGGWGDRPLHCRSAHRDRLTPADRSSGLGFRPARSSVE